ncbi:GH92 family glycosyl hydrolase [Kitasatospora sp. NPDC088346]|uniref:GH92 family glycosyl hydrolase n=1 Tax=Kitasatospora sp. NPDC088346 TaxID=3364073 RepID=UPI0037F1EB50
MTETNIMVGTNADSIIAEAVNKGFHGFDLDLAYQAVRKDATTPPDKDATTWYGDRQEGTPVEARAGLTTYLKNGWVAADKTAEAGARSLDYAYEDWAVAQVARAASHGADAATFLDRSRNYTKLFNATTGFMQARKLDGSWADGAWTEGDQWVYTNGVLHDVPGLIALKGGDASYSAWLDTYFAGGHNNHTNEPSHHVPYLYDYAGRPWRTQQLVRQIAAKNYHNAPGGLSGNDDCGQMSAWYLFSVMGFYPVNPASDQYAVGSPFFEKVTVDLPGTSRPLVISAPAAAGSPYVQALSLNGKKITKPFLSHRDLTGGGDLAFTMNSAPQAWGASTTPPEPPVANLALDRPVQMLNGTPAAEWGKPAGKAVDGDPSTMAQSTTGAPWSLRVDLGTTATVGRAVVDPDWENYPVSYDVKVSTDGTAWTTVVGQASAGGTDGCAGHGVATCGQSRTHTFTPVRARYVLLSVNNWTNARTGKPADDYGWALREFEVYPAAGSTDRKPPTTNASSAPASPDGRAGWYTGPVTVGLTASDEAGGSGVARTEYRLAGAGAYTPYTGPLTLKAAGSHTLVYRSVDRAGNVEADRTATVRIDGVAPTLTVDGVADRGVYGDSGSLPVTVTTADVGSGVGGVGATVDGRRLALPTAPLTLRRLRLGGHTVVVTAEDRAGNATVVERRFAVTTSLADVRAIVEQAVAAGRLDRSGADKLLARIGQVAAAEGRGHRKQVVTQLGILLRMTGGTSGVRLSTEDRDLLARDIRFLIVAAGGTAADAGLATAAYRTVADQVASAEGAHS